MSLGMEEIAWCGRNLLYSLFYHYRRDKVDSKVRFAHWQVSSVEHLWDKIIGARLNTNNNIGDGVRPECLEMQQRIDNKHEKIQSGRKLGSHSYVMFVPTHAANLAEENSTSRKKSKRKRVVENGYTLRTSCRKRLHANVQRAVAASSRDLLYTPFKITNSLTFIRNS